MEGEQLNFLLFGIVWISIGVGLTFVKIDKKDLESKVHTMPGLSLYRVPAFRWTITIALIVVGIVFLSMGLGWL